MIAADTSTWIAYWVGHRAADTDRLAQALADEVAVMVPVVATELFSAQDLQADLAHALASIPWLDIAPGYWRRAGELRAGMLRHGRKARLGDALIAQSCLDHGIALITRDRDFAVFAEGTKLKLITN